jgi:hypothetical protein
MASQNCAEIRPAKLKQWHAVCYMIARCMSYRTAHRLPRLVAQRDFLASHKPRDIRQSETPALVAGFFMRDAKPKQLFGFTGTLLILNGFIGSGLVQAAPPLHRKVG